MHQPTRTTTRRARCLPGAERRGQRSERPTRPARPAPVIVRIVAILLMAGTALLAGCGAPATPPLPALDCEREGYPCTFAEVPLAVIERSLELAAAAGSMFEAGASVDEVIAFLEAEDGVAEVDHDGSAVEFRLTEGRPVVVDPTIDVARLPYENVQAPPAVASSLAPQRVVGAPGSRRALVLSPFAFDFDGWDSGAQAAAVLAATPGYEGRVTYRETTDPDDPGVTVDDLLDLEAYDVVYLSTHGGRLCLDKKTSSALAASGVGGAGDDCRADFLIQRFAGTAADLKALDQPGIVLYQGSKHRSIAVTGDFFRAVYPDGLPNTLFVLVSCSTYSPEFVGPIAGDEGIFVSWDLGVRADIALASLKLLQVLSVTGWTVSDAMASLGDAVVSEETGAVMRSSGRRAGGDLRIRDVIRVEDGFTGDDLATAVEIEVAGAPDDGEPDSILLDITVDAVTEATASGFTLHVTINDRPYTSTSLTAVGEAVGDHAWHVPAEIDLGFDAMEGEELRIEAWVELPEGGTSRVEGAPAVAGSPTELGSTWQGQVTYTSERLAGDWTMSIVADATFEREPGTLPTDRYQTFALTGGSYVVTLQGEDALGCTVSGTISGPLEADEDTYLDFDTATSPILVEAWGSSNTPPMVASVSCPDGSASSQTVTTNSVMPYIPDDIVETVSNGTIDGTYVVTNADRRQTWTWNVARVE